MTGSRSSTTAAPTRAPRTTTRHACWTEDRLDGRRATPTTGSMWFGPTPLHRRPALGQRGAGRDGPLARPRSSGTTAGAPLAPQDRRRPARRRHRPVPEVPARSVPGPDGQRCASRSDAETLQTRSQHPAPGRRRTRRPTTTSPAGSARSTAPTTPRSASRSPTPTGPPCSRSSRTASATGGCRAVVRAPPRPGCATAPATAGTPTAAATCPAYPPTPVTAGPARPSASCFTTKPARGRPGPH